MARAGDRLKVRLVTGGSFEAEYKMAQNAWAQVQAGKAMVMKALPVIADYLEQLSRQSADAVKTALLTGEFPGAEHMGPELKSALQVFFMLVVEGLDAWNGLSPEKRGYYTGYLVFEAVVAKAAGVVTAWTGGGGAAAMLCRHAPKLVSMLGHVRGAITKLSRLPGRDTLLGKIDNWIAFFVDAGCFAPGTLVLTTRGRLAIEQVQAGDWVWCRAEDGSGDWGWRPVVEKIVTHPQVLYEVRVSMAASETCALMKDYQPYPPAKRPIWVNGYPFRIFGLDAGRRLCFGEAFDFGEALLGVTNVIGDTGW